MNKRETCIDEWATRCRELQQQVEALQAQLAAAQNVKADYDRWLSGGVYFTTAEYEKHVAEHRQHVEALQRERDEWKGRYEAAQALTNGAYEQIGEMQAALNAEREKVKGLEAQNTEWERKCRDLCLAHGPLLIEHHDVKRDLSQLQALVRALPVVRIDLNGVYHDTLLAQPEDDAVKELLRYRASLDATTPAADTSIIGKC